MVERIKSKNDNFRQLKLRLKQSPKQSYIELDNVLGNTKDKKAFVYLVDFHETEKEITREILEGLLDAIIELNTDYIDFISHKKETPEFLHLSNLKTMLIWSMGLGLTISIVFNESVANKIIDAIFKSETEKKGDK